MEAVLPGRPQVQLQALSTGHWNGRRIIAYVSGSSIAVIGPDHRLLQTIYDADDDQLEAVAFDEATGALAAASATRVTIYKPVVGPGSEPSTTAPQWSLQDSFDVEEDPSAGAAPSPTQPSAAAPSRWPPVLSWGRRDELLVATSYLTLYDTSTPSSPPTAAASTTTTPTTAQPPPIRPIPILWRKRLSSRAKYAILSYDSAYAATVGGGGSGGSCGGRGGEKNHGGADPLVKVWRRLSYGADDVRFDFAYLRHPSAVTGIQWRRPHHVDQTSVENVLFTFCADAVLRIWTGPDPGHHHRGQSGGTVHGGPNLQLWGSIDLAAAARGSPARVVNGSSSAGAGPRLAAFIIQARDFSCAVENAVASHTETSTGRTRERSTASKDGRDAALDHVVAVANKNAEVCVVLDSKGGFSALAMENVGCKTQKGKISHIVQATSPALDLRGSSSRGPDGHVEIYNYCNRGSGLFHILIHNVDGGRIDAFAGDISHLLDPLTTRQQRLRWLHVWTGLSAPIKKIVRNFSGRAVVSRTDWGQCLVWNYFLNPPDPSTARLPWLIDVPTSGRIERICVLRKGRFVVFLRRGSIELWDCRQSPARLLSSCPYAVPGKPLCLLILPRVSATDYARAHIATVTSEQRGVVWEVLLPEYQNKTGEQSREPSICEFCTFGLTDAGDLAYVLPVDPAGSSPIIAGFLDVFARDVAISYTHSGRVEFWTARVDPEKRTVGWLSTSWLETGVTEPALVSGSSTKKAALVNASRTELSVWDIRAGRLEFARTFDADEPIRDLDWTSTNDDHRTQTSTQSILAVGFGTRVLMLCQMRFDYLNHKPAWAVVREVGLGAVTPHPIGDSAWLGDGYLVVGAGNQLFVYGPEFHVTGELASGLRLPHRRDGAWNLFEIAKRLNGPLPVYHPQFLIQVMLAGKTAAAQRILLALHRTLKYYCEGDVIDDYLGLDVEDLLSDAQQVTAARGVERHQSSFIGGELHDGDETSQAFSEETAESIREKLTVIALPRLSGHEQIQLVDIVECAGLVEKHRRSMDENGSRFMLFFRQHALRKGRTNEIHMSWREICWAYHSTSQDILVDFVTRQYHGSVLWENARESGMFMWLTDNSAVRAQFEIVARNEYTKSETKNPVDCSLFYLALKKKAVLQGLWRMAGWHREQAATMRLLANDFNDPKWRTVALKNAYALMSKRRFEYAAAFFLLADHLQDAINVCLAQLQDLQLAIAIARVYEGDNGPIFRKLLEEDVLSIAAQEGNRWLASWAFWMLHRRDMAVRALVTPVFALLETPVSPDLKSRSFLTDDPALIVLYAQLRQKTLQTLRGASKITPRVEWEFILHNARLYARMGCDILGLDLVRNWEFLHVGTTIKPGLGGEIDPIKLTRRRSSLVVADLPVQPQLPLELKAGHQKATPTMFEEPDANSLLDSFGF